MSSILKTLKIPRLKKVIVKSFSLEVLSGEDSGKKFFSTKDEVFLGTQDTNDIVLTDRTVSRIHAKITRDREGFFIEDLGSSNGTYIEGIRIVRAYLPEKCKIKLGRVVMEFSVYEKEKEIIDDDEIDGIVAKSGKMKEVLSYAYAVADSPSPILIMGETGVGKEVLAQFIHKLSSRRDKKFIVCDITTIPEDLIIPEIFGYKRGAFTDAKEDKVGIIEMADGGTVFIDEIGDMPLEAQSALLRFIEKKEIRRVGDVETKKVDVRIISATNKDIEEEIKERRFRVDLFHRFTITIKIPPLRERREDIRPLFEKFIKDLAGNEDVSKFMDFFDENQNFFYSYSFPGNVRELKNIAEKVYISLKNGLRFELISNKIEDIFSLPFKEFKSALLSKYEKEYIIKNLEKNKFNISKTAKEIGIDRKYLEKLMEKYGIEKV